MTKIYVATTCAPQQEVLCCNRLLGGNCDFVSGERPSRHLAPSDLDVLSPIDDVRATADYRREAARTLVARAVDLAAGAGAHA